MGNQKVRMTVEFEIEEEILKEYGVSAQTVMDSIVFGEDDIMDGFYITTNVPGYNPVDVSFLKYGSLVSIEAVSEQAVDKHSAPIRSNDPAVHNGFSCMDISVLGDLYHVGTMDISQKRNYSHEGDGLSVSICPDEWCKITEGYTSGDYFLLSKPDMKLLDYYALTPAEIQEIEAWAIENDYVRKGTLYQSVCSYDEEGNEYFSLFDDYQAALLEADCEKERVCAVDGLLPTRKLIEQSFVKVELLDVPDIITSLYAENVLNYDGVYWDELLDVNAYSAPRGVIFNSKINSFDIVNTTKELETHKNSNEHSTHRVFTLNDLISTATTTASGNVDVPPKATIGLGR